VQVIVCIPDCPFAHYERIRKTDARAALYTATSFVLSGGVDRDFADVFRELQRLEDEC
jgi:hypothetical protein